MEGQIIKILSDIHFVKYKDNIYDCKCRGKFRNDNISPVVGDYVVFNEQDKIINEVKPRKNILIRPPVANIDQCFVITSLKDPDFSDNLLDKLLVMLEYHHIKPIICLTKLDLISNSKKKELLKIISYYKKIGYKVIKNTNIFQIKLLLRNKTTAFTGQTGAGKSTLLNRLNKNLNLETNEISYSLGRGKHTTRHVEIIEMFKGKVLDTPGFSLIDFNQLDISDFKNMFIEFRNINCEYKDCNHINEEHCEVKEMVKNNLILKSRYNNYIKIVKEKR
ncbi:MAG: ribosome small subunit-dependent GTPase A [Bacilli bacterium]